MNNLNIPMSHLNCIFDKSYSRLRSQTITINTKYYSGSVLNIFNAFFNTYNVLVNYCLSKVIYAGYKIILFKYIPPPTSKILYQIYSSIHTTQIASHPMSISPNKIQYTI